MNMLTRFMRFLSLRTDSSIKSILFFIYIIIAYIDQTNISIYYILRVPMYNLNKLNNMFKCGSLNARAFYMK